MTNPRTDTLAEHPTGAGIPSWGYKLLIVLATIIWGLSFVVLKDAVDVLPPAYLLAVRFLTCGILMALFLFKRMRAHFDRGHVLNGIVIGTLMCTAYWFQTVGLTDTTPGKNAFLTASYCVMVPFIWWLFARRKPTVFNVVAAVICVIGIGLVSMAGEGASSLAMSRGDVFTLVGALFFALHIVYVAKVSPGRDIYVLTTYQFLVVGAECLIVALFTETWPAGLQLTPDFIGEMLYLTFLATLVTLLIQNMALQHVPPAQTSLLLSLESVFGVLFSVLLYHEQLTARLVVGFSLIFVAVALSETGADVRKDLERRRGRSSDGR